MRTAFLCLLFIVGLTPTAIMGLAVIANAGKPVPCDRPDCQAKTYGAELLILPASTLAPFACGIAIATLATKRKKQSNAQRSPALAVARRHDETTA